MLGKLENQLLGSEAKVNRKLNCTANTIVRVVDRAGDDIEKQHFARPKGMSPEHRTFPAMSVETRQLERRLVLEKDERNATAKISRTGLMADHAPISSSLLSLEMPFLCPATNADNIQVSLHFPRYAELNGSRTGWAVSFAI